MKTFFKIVLVVLIVYVCAVAGEFFGGVLGATAAAFLHASPYLTVLIVRVLATVFFFGFVLAAWVIYSRRRARKSRRKTAVTTR